MINWGIVGTGHIANKFAKAVTKVEDSNLLAVASRTLDKAKEFGTEYGAKKFYGSYEEMAADPEIDAVYISTPNTMHMENTLLFLKNKKAVLCEKPIAMNSEETKKMIDCARENGVFLMEAMWTRFLPVLKMAKEAVINGVIGDVKCVTANFGYALPEGYPDTGRLIGKELGGGALLDIGIYPLSFANWIMGKPKKIQSMIVNYHTGVDLTTAMQLMYEHGEMAILFCTFSADIETAARIYGTKGSIYLPKFYMGEEITIELQTGEMKHFKIPHRVNGFEYEIEEVNNCLKNKKLESDVISLDESYEIMKQIDEMLNGSYVL